MDWLDSLLSRRQIAHSAYIDGAWAALHGPLQEIVNPATEQVIATMALGDTDDVDLAVQAARAAFPAFSMLQVTTRAQYLERIHAWILAHADVFACAMCLEMGATITHARNAHVTFALEHLRVAREVMMEYPFSSMRGTTAIVREPVGVCGLITPWNWPLYQIAAKVAPAIAAGCTLVLKPSELAPLSALLFARAVEAAGLPPGVFNLVNGAGAEVGHALAAHPDVDMISITGSTRAGIAVAQAAAPTIKRVTQELGGKSPNLLLPDADFANAVPQGVMAAFRNVGQSCSAPTRMLVPYQRLDEVERLATNTANAMTVGDPFDSATTLGPLANRAQFERVQAMIGMGLEEGARLLCGGPGRPAGLECGFFVRPSIFSGVSPQMRIAQEEIFGPVLCIIGYASVDEAVDIANATVYGLGAHVHGQDLDHARAVALRIRSGQVHLNSPPWDPFAPFGGYKQSGNGREFGEWGLAEFLETKAILGVVNETK